jgi:type III secretion protein SpaR/YscT/HrcT
MDEILRRLGLDLALDPGRLILLGGLAAARVVPIFAIAPFFGGRLVPVPLRIGIAAVFVALVWPAVAAGAPADPSALGPGLLAALLLKEILLGALLGFLVAVPFWAAEAAGRLVDGARGASNQELHVPQTGATSSPLGDLGLQLAVVAFFAMDGHLLFLRSLGESYRAVPVTGFPAHLVAGGATTLAVDATSRLLLAAIGLAAPALAALLLADVALGLVNRVSPHVQVFFLGMPLRATLGVLVFMLALAAFVSALRGEIGAALGAVRAALGGGGP